MLRSRTSLLWAVCLVAGVATAQSDFSFYPEGAQNCLNSSSSQTDCESTNVPEMNECYCNNGGNFIINVARCVGEESENDVSDTYSTMQEACSNSNTPMSVSQSDFFAAANGEDVSTTTTQPPTSTQTQTDEPTSTGTSTSTTTSTNRPSATGTNDPQPDGDDDNGGLSSGATIGIGVGAGLGGLALIGVAVFFFLRRRKRVSEESNPMLPDHRYHAPTTFPPSEPSPGFGGFTDTKPSPSGSPYSNNTHSGQWQSPPLFQGQQSPQPYPQQPYQAFTPDQRLSAYAPQQAFADPHAPRIEGPVEMDGVQQQQQNIAEMPGSSPQPTWRP